MKSGRILLKKIMRKSVYRESASRYDEKGCKHITFSEFILTTSGMKSTSGLMKNISVTKNGVSKNII